MVSFLYRGIEGEGVRRGKRLGRKIGEFYSSKLCFVVVFFFFFGFFFPLKGNRCGRWGGGELPFSLGYGREGGCAWHRHTHTQ